MRVTGGATWKRAMRTDLMEALLTMISRLAAGTVFGRSNTTRSGDESFIACGVIGAEARISTCIPFLPRTTDTFFTLAALAATDSAAISVAAVGVIGSAVPPVTFTSRAL